MISEKTKLAVPMALVWSFLAFLLVTFLSSYFALYAKVVRLESNDQINCLIILNIQNYTVPTDKRIARKCE
jgi:hypothetical protein